MTDDQRYFSLLRLEKAKPSLAHLADIVQAQLARVPYENISKLIRGSEGSLAIPEFGEFVDALAEKHFGGTCFTQNIHLNQLLIRLGFQSQLVGVRRDGGLSHVNIRVSIDGRNYLVDCGIMSSIAGPFQIHPGHAFDTRAGNQRYVYIPSQDLENYLLEIHRDGNLIRSFQTTSEPIAASELALGIAKTFERSAMFMTTLCVHRAFAGHSVGIWNNHLYRVKGTEHVVRDIQNFAELKEAFRTDLGLPDYPLRLALNLLEKNGAAKIF